MPYSDSEVSQAIRTLLGKHGLCDNDIRVAILICCHHQTMKSALHELKIPVSRASVMWNNFLHATGAATEPELRRFFKEEHSRQAKNLKMFDDEFIKQVIEQKGLKATYLGELLQLFNSNGFKLSCLYLTQKTKTKNKKEVKVWGEGSKKSREAEALLVKFDATDLSGLKTRLRNLQSNGFQTPTQRKSILDMDDWEDGAGQDTDLVRDPVTLKEQEVAKIAEKDFETTQAAEPIEEEFAETEQDTIEEGDDDEEGDTEDPIKVETVIEDKGETQEDILAVIQPTPRVRYIPHKISKRVVIRSEIFSELFASFPEFYYEIEKRHLLPVYKIMVDGWNQYGDGSYIRSEIAKTLLRDTKIYFHQETLMKIISSLQWLDRFLWLYSDNPSSAVFDDANTQEYNELVRLLSIQRKYNVPLRPTDFRGDFWVYLLRAAQALSEKSKSYKR